MNTAPFRPAGSVGHLATPKFSRSKLALLVSAAAAAMTVAGFVMVGLSEPDSTQTAAVPLHVTLPQTTDMAEAPPPSEGTSTPKQARSPTAQMAAPRASDTARLETSSTPEAADAPSEQVVAGPEQRELIAAAQTSSQPASTAPDATDTASIPAEGLRGPLDVQVAETEAEIAKLEADTGMTEETEANSEAQPAPAAPAVTKLAPVSQPDLKPATVTKHVNLREAPADEAEVLTVVPENASIEAETDCGWCTVVYKGQRGYIYKSFIDRGTAEKAADAPGLY
ncbi:SH3 domain-containing protein [Mesorhizobium sp. ANAO-SY3R2]|uniref:SH3 domain-containing protein n=1 Tax=Mesorhizobium sp. ANAO-SY3R2 TaxID=3166644 RepID=UPI00366D79EF